MCILYQEVNDMGVLACDRDGCTNIMCDRYSHNFGYICGDCFSEMVDYILVNGKFSSLSEDVREFLNTPKRSKDETSLREDIWKILDEEFQCEEVRRADYE
jgi:hypothetical protein